MWTLGDAHFKVDGVAIDVDFGGLDVRKHVAMVVIEVGDGVVIRTDALGKQLLIVDISFLHAELCLEQFGGIDRVSHPSDMAQVVALAFLYLHIHIDMVVVCRPNAVF